MKKLAMTTAAALYALAAVSAWGEWVYEGKWGTRGSGEGQFKSPSDVAVAANRNVYVADKFNNRVQYFTATGSFLGKWGTLGSGNGQFAAPEGIAVAPNGNVYVADEVNCRIQYFTSSGSFLGKWGSHGMGDGQFNWPKGVALNGAGTRVYVADSENHRIQYFKWVNVALEPASLGKVKALFK
jgi:tripartite motif-containing protein 71